jgi:phenylalanyl-tRNA synthetase alpha chain
MSTAILSGVALRRALAIRDLTDPEQGPHALQLLVRDAADALARAWGSQVRVVRASPLASVADNYDRLLYSTDAVTRDERYTRYVCDGAVLRTHTSSMIPPALRRLATEGCDDELLVCPAMVYRRDCIDRIHTGEPHQLDLWRIRRGPPLGPADLEEMIACVLDAVLPGVEIRRVAAVHPYTTDGRQVDARAGDDWVEVGECGVAHPQVLAACGLDPAAVGGMAIGLGLDRLLMLRKGIADIRLLRSTDPRVAAQMLDLSPYRAVSSQPAIQRDLSIVVHRDTTAEALGDAVRDALAERATAIETIAVLSETPCAQLPAPAVRRLGIAADQKNILVRLVIRDLDRTLTHAEANEIRDAVYAAVHCGTRSEWAGRRNQ